MPFVAWLTYCHASHFSLSTKCTNAHLPHTFHQTSADIRMKEIMHCLLLGNGINRAALQKDWTQILRELAQQFNAEDLRRR